MSTDYPELPLTPSDRSPVLVRTIAAPSEPRAGRFAPIWRASDVKTYPEPIHSPDWKANFVFFGFMIDYFFTGSDEFDALRDEIDACAVAEMYRLANLKQSVDTNYEYRPTGYRSKTCVLGQYDITDDRYNWIAVDFTMHVPNEGGAIRSTTWFSDPKTKPTWKRDWDPGVYLDNTGKYHVVVDYCDCDQDWGLGFVFSFKKI